MVFFVNDLALFGRRQKGYTEVKQECPTSAGGVTVFSLVSQGHHGVDLHRPACRHVGREQSGSD